MATTPYSTNMRVVGSGKAGEHGPLPEGPTTGVQTLWAALAQALARGSIYTMRQASRPSGASDGR